MDEVEAKLIANGQAYGYTGEALRTYVEERIEKHEEKVRADRERDERAGSRLERKDDEQLLARIADLELQVQHTRETQSDESTLLNTTNGSLASKRAAIKMPKFDGKQTVETYLELFEDVAKQNEFSDDEYLIRLRVAVAGSKLEGACYGCNTFAEAKRELLMAHGKTADKAWQALMAIQQKSDESFYQFVVRVTRETEKWAKLARPSRTSSRGQIGELDDTELFGCVVRQVLLEAVSAETKAFLIEKRCYTKDLKAFAEDGMAYQTAHGRSKLKPAKSSTSDKRIPFASAECLTVSVDEANKKLSAMASEHRNAYVKAEGLCFNCLRPGHRVMNCQNKGRCKHCNKRHHSLLHREDKQVTSEPIAESKVGTYECSANSVHLMTGVAEVQGPSRKASVRIFIDPGAQASFITAPLVNSLQPAHLGSQTVRLKAFDVEPKFEKMDRYRVTIKGATKSISVNAWQKKSLGLRFDPLADSTIARWQSQGLQLSDDSTKAGSSEVHMLIGADYCNEFLLRKEQINGETAWHTEIGWVLSGPANSETKSATVSVSCIELDRLWKMEEVPEIAETLPDFPIERQGPHYQVGLLWRSEKRPPANLNQAMAAAHSLLKQLQRRGQRPAYDDVLITEYLKLDAIEKEPHPEEAGYYMPHHAVFRSDASTTKTRVVFNASAACTGAPSLNDMVDPGPSLLPDLTGILLRFREYECAVQADIRKAFFMIGMREEDRPYLRFVWPEIGSEEMCIWRLKKLPFGVNCSPFILSAVLRFHLDSAFESASAAERDIIELLLRSFYVDDCVSSLPCCADAEKLQEYSVNVLQGAGMELRKWRGNTMTSDPEAGSKALGIVWNTESDCISVAALGDVECPKEVSGWSRRALLRCVAAVFDPLGWASPAVVPGKMMLQESWKLGGGWDDPFPIDLAVRCASWWGELAALSSVKIPRWIGCTPDAPVTLHVFSDASEKGYGCCFYVVSGLTSSLLCAKAKVAPVVRPTLARLELSAVCLGVKMLSFVVNELRVPIERIVGWTDSLTTWHWISKPSYHWKTYVANRVAAVQEVSQKLQVEWRHCPGVSNPADLVSRGVPVCDLQKEMWLHGPSWLSDESQWPPVISFQSTNESVTEARVSAVEVDTPVVWPWEKFSKWQRARGLVASMLSWRHKGVSRAELIPSAESVMFRAIQEQCFPKELSQLRSKEPLKKGSKLFKLSPFLDEAGLLRVRGRLQESDLSYEVQHPIILGRCHLSELFLRDAHLQRMHQGVESVLAFLQQQFWILGARRFLRSVSEKCIVCRRFRAQTAAEEMPPLPSDRVKHHQPFGLTGIDYAGPLYVRSSSNVQKVWVALFVCGTTRAVHLELVDSLSTEVFLLALRRFIARRGKPLRIRSDNATTFKSAADKVAIPWFFNPPSAPWHGGFYERLVACVKAPLKKVLGRASLSRDELFTVLTEIERVVNSRPLTPVSTDVADESPLTPAMMLGDIFATGIASSDRPLDPRQLSARVKYVHTVYEHLNQRWSSEYLIRLSEYHRSKSTPIVVNDVVFIADDNRKRQSWRLGRVAELYPGRDGKCRVAKVQVGQSSMLRPIQRLVPLEVAKEHVEPPAVDAEPQPQSPASADPVNVVDDVEIPSTTVEPQVTRPSRRTVRPPPRLDL